MEIPAIKAFYSHREGLVELDDDVLSIVRQIRELYGQRVRVAWEPTTGMFVFSEICEDETERLIFVTQSLDGRALRRLLQADGHRSGYEDAYDRQEREQDEAFAAREEAERERLRDQGERLAHALKKDFIGPYPLQIAVPRGIDGANDADGLR